MLKIINYTKKYSGGKVAVSDLSLTIEKGDLFGETNLRNSDGGCFIQSE